MVRIITLIILIATVYLQYPKLYKRVPLNCRDICLAELEYEKVNASKDVFNIGSHNYELTIDFVPYNRDWIFLKKLGEGASAQVFMVQDVVTQEYNTLKYYKEPSNHPLQNYILNELQYSVNWSICPHSGQKIAIYNFVDGKNLSNLRYSQTQLNLLIYKLILKLNKAHQNGIIHSDIKPSNILIDYKTKDRQYFSPTLNLQILDWNLAKPYYEGKKYHSQQGTFKYLAPQLIIKSQYYTPAVDIWSLGVTFFKIITGKTIIQPSSLEIKSLVKAFGFEKIVKFYNKLKPFGHASIIKYIRENQENQLGTFQKQLTHSNCTNQQKDFLRKILVLEPENRPSLKQLLNDPLFYYVRNLDHPGSYKAKKKQQDKIQKMKQNDISQPNKGRTRRKK